MVLGHCLSCDELAGLRGMWKCFGADFDAWLCSGQRTDECLACGGDVGGDVDPTWTDGCAFGFEIGQSPFTDTQWCEIYPAHDVLSMKR